MKTIVKMNLHKQDVIKTPENVKLETTNVDGVEIQRFTAQPGWKWSMHNKPLIGGESCQKQHLVYVLSGKLHAKMNDGTEVEFVPGEAGVIPPGHDGWNAEDKPAVWLEFPH